MNLHTNLDRKKRLSNIFLWLFISLFLSLVSACSNGPSENVDSGSSQGIAIPTAISRLALPTDTVSFTAAIFLDENASPLASKSIANGETTIGFSDLEVPIGNHTFTLKFRLETKDYDILLATSVSNPVEITEGSNQSLSFDINNYNYNYDNDSDLVLNIDEIKAGSPPDKDTCVIGVSYLDHCSLGA